MLDAWVFDIWVAIVLCENNNCCYLHDQQTDTETTKQTYKQTNNWIDK